VQISPVVQPGSAVWQGWHEGSLALGVWTEKVHGRGEDAEPLLLHHGPTRSGLLAVFDGLGGSGAHTAGRTADGSERTSAWVGSRVSRTAAQEWFQHSVRRSFERDAESLREALVQRFGQLSARRSKIVSRMRKEFPSTIAALDYRLIGGQLIWRCLWAGDSRAFVLHPVDGLQQLSRDDTESDDALELLVQDPPMTNVISADSPFHLNDATGEAYLPVVLLCASDGFFGYVDTPAHFEHILLETLGQAQDSAHWGELLRGFVVARTGDDASLVLVALGFDSFQALQRSFHPRSQAVLRDHWTPLQGLGDRDALLAARARSWNDYRTSYEQRMPSREGRRP
jgi:hypothetical protein